MLASALFVDATLVIVEQVGALSEGTEAADIIDVDVSEECVVCPTVVGQCTSSDKGTCCKTKTFTRHVTATEESGETDRIPRGYINIIGDASTRVQTITGSVEGADAFLTSVSADILGPEGFEGSATRPIDRGSNFEFNVLESVLTVTSVVDGA